MSESSHFERLVTSLESIEDNDVRVKYVADLIGRLGVDEAPELVRQAYQAALHGATGNQVIFLLVALALTDERVADVRTAVAESTNELELSQMFQHYETGDDPAAKRTPDLGQGRPLTLGERKSLARTRNRNLIARVVHDPHVAVISILLDNPFLTENDVVRLCAKRPVPAQVLQAVFHHRKWVFRYRARSALVRNPHFPLPLALQLTLTLTAQDQRELCRSHDLHDLIRLLARASLQVRVASQPP